MYSKKKKEKKKESRPTDPDFFRYVTPTKQYFLWPNIHIIVSYWDEKRKENMSTYLRKKRKHYF